MHRGNSSKRWLITRREGWGPSIGRVVALSMQVFKQADVTSRMILVSGGTYALIR